MSQLKPPPENRLPPIGNHSSTVSKSARPRLPPLASIHQLPSQPHGRLQNVSNVPLATGQPHTLLDSTFKQSMERMQAELVHFRSICTRALQREQQDKESLRLQCMTLMRERDVAREKIRTLMARKGGEVPIVPPFPTSEAILPISPTSLPSPSSASADPVHSFDSPAFMLQYPEDSTCMSHSPPQKRKHAARSASADPVLYSPCKHDERPPPVPERKRRRMSNSSGSSSPTVVGDSDGASIKMMPKVSLVSAESAAQVAVSHVDIMYMPVNGRLVCRACILRNQSESAKPISDSVKSLVPPKSFPSNASWDALKKHCADEHPSECADLARLGPTQIMELRRRLGPP